MKLPLDLSMPGLARNRLAGFTMVELLAVIAIIAVVAALAFPALTNMRKRAMDAKAANNLKQLAAAQIQYASENNSTYATDWTPEQPTPWAMKLMPYLFGREAVDIHEVRRLRSDPRSVFNVPDSEPADDRSLGENTIALNWMLPLPTWRYRANRVPRPASIILFTESHLANADLAGPPNSSGRFKSALRRNNGKSAMVSFCDGHVEAVGELELSVTQPKADNLWLWW